MLTIKTPIELHTNTFRLRDDGGFAQRILGDYALMGSDVSSQSLTHLLHTPPEILVTEGGDASISSTTNIYAFRREQQTVLNNVMNRVLLSNRFGLTYQDRVYITDVLHKLGIRDDRRFMEEVRQLLSETDNSRELTDLYVENIGQLRTLLALTNQVTERQETTEVSEQETNEENRLYLAIMNRLQTGAIYQIMNNMNRSTSASIMNTTEVQTSEQTYIARQLLLSRFREMAAGEQQPLIYRAENVYEEETRIDAEATDKEIRERINSAVLLEVLRSFDHAISTRNDRNVLNWMNFNNSFYKAADTALTRILLEAREHRSAAIYEHSDLAFVNETETRELQLLREITAGETERLETLLAEAQEYSSEYEETLLTEREQTLEETRTERERYGEEIRRDRKFRESTIAYLERESLERELTEEERLELEQLRTEQTRQERMLEQTSRELSENREETRVEHTFLESALEHRTSDSQETVVEEIDRINRQNTENLERYREIRRLYAREMQRDRSKVSDRERTMRESLKVLMNKEHLKELLEQPEPEKPSEINRLLERIYALLPADSVEIFRQMDMQMRGEAPQTVQQPEPEVMEQELVHFLESAEVPPEVQEQYLEARRREQEEEMPASAPVQIDRAIVENVVRQFLAEGPAGILLRHYSTLVTRDILAQERIIAERERVIRLESAPAENEVLRLTIAGEMGGDRPTAEVQIRRGAGQAEISFVHRREQHLTEEDVRETLEEYRRSGEQKTRVVEEAPHVTEVVRQAPQIVNQSIQTMSRQDSEEIATLVERGIRQQLSTITGEVYTRLEKRLRSEKSRRGI